MRVVRLITKFIFDITRVLVVSLLAIIGLVTLTSVPFVWVMLVDNWYPYNQNNWLVLLAFGPVILYIAAIFVAFARLGGHDPYEHLTH